MPVAAPARLSGIPGAFHAERDWADIGFAWLTSGLERSGVTTGNTGLRAMKHRMPRVDFHRTIPCWTLQRAGWITGPRTSAGPFNGIVYRQIHALRTLAEHTGDIIPDFAEACGLRGEHLDIQPGRSMASSLAGLFTSFTELVLPV